MFFFCEGNSTLSCFKEIKQQTFLNLHQKKKRWERRKRLSKGKWLLRERVKKVKRGNWARISHRWLESCKRRIRSFWSKMETILHSTIFWHSSKFCIYFLSAQHFSRFFQLRFQYIGGKWGVLSLSDFHSSGSVRLFGSWWKEQWRKLPSFNPITLRRSASKDSVQSQPGSSSSALENINNVFLDWAIWICMNNRKAKTVLWRKINAWERKIRRWKLLGSLRCVGLLTDDEAFVQRKGRGEREITLSQCNIWNLSNSFRFFCNKVSQVQHHALAPHVYCIFSWGKEKTAWKGNVQQWQEMMHSLHLTWPFQIPLPCSPLTQLLPKNFPHLFLPIRLLPKHPCHLTPLVLLFYSQ